MTLGPNSSHHFPLGSLMMLMAQFPLGLCHLWPVSIKSLPNLTQKKRKSQGIVLPKNSQPWDWIIWSMWHLSTATVNQVPLNYKNCQRNSKPNYSRRFGFGSVSCHATYDFSLDHSYVKSVSPFPNLIQLFHIHKLLSKLVCSFSLSSPYVNAFISLLTLL